MKQFKSIKRRLALAMITPALLFNMAPVNASAQNMQSCQGLIDFLQIKLKGAAGKYSASDIQMVSKGLGVYNRYIQTEVVTPSLVKFSQGDTAKAQALQGQVDALRASIVKDYSSRFPENKLYMDFVVALNNCTKNSVPKGNDFDVVKASMLKMVEMIKQN